MALTTVRPEGLGFVNGRRNLIINGAMQVAQRGTSATGVTTSGYKTVDRFRVSESGLGTAVFTHAQATDAPDGFANSLKLTTTTAEGAVGADDRLSITYAIEGQDLQHLQYGISSAKKVTLSFYVKSSLTGTYSVAFYATNASNRLITSTYTINSANTWELKTITFDGDTSVAFTNDNTAGLTIFFNLGAGSDTTSTDSTSWIDYNSSGLAYGQTAQFQNTLNATWQITGVQLELGTNASDFEHRSYGEEQALCQRYYQTYRAGGYNPRAYANLNNYSYAAQEVSFATAMRASPTATETDAPTFSNCDLLRPGSLNKNTCAFIVDSDTSGGAYYARDWEYEFDAEL